MKAFLCPPSRLNALVLCHFRSWPKEAMAFVQIDAPGTENPCLTELWSWMNPPFPLLALWGNKNWPPSMKVKKLKIFWNKMGSMGCKWSSLNAPGTESSLSHSFWHSGSSNFRLLRLGRAMKDTNGTSRRQSPLVIFSWWTNAICVSYTSNLLFFRLG